MDKRKSILNVSVSLFFKIVTMVMAIVVKRFLIQSCGPEVNGLNALYLSVIGLLSVAELGVGSAITFCMYKPIVDGDNDQVSALYHLFRRCYLVIGGVVLAGGCAIMPFIRYIVRDFTNVGVNLHTTFGLMLVSVVATYLYSAKTSLLNAYKNNYISTAITSGGIVLQQVLQVVVLLTTKSFTGYLICRIVAVIAQWAVTALFTEKKYHSIMVNKQQISGDTKSKLHKSIKAMLKHKVGTLLVNTTDSIIISAFVGVVALGNYSNYATIMTSLSGILQVIFTSMISVVGHYYAKERQEIVRQCCDTFHILNFLFAEVFFLGYYAVIDELVTLLFGMSSVSRRSLAAVMALNGFVQFLRRSTLMFRDATGTFRNDSWKPLVEGVVNIVMSIMLLNLIGVAGVIISTIATSLVVCHVVEPYTLYKYAFAASAKGYYLRNYGFILVFAASMWALDKVRIQTESSAMSILINGSVSVGIAAVICGCVLLVMRQDAEHIRSALFRKIKDSRNG